MTLTLNRIPTGTTASPFDSISLGIYTLKDLWTAGIINDAGYVALALEFEKNSWTDNFKAFDVAEFVRRWEVEIPQGDDRPPKLKALKPKAVRDAIDKLAENELIAINRQLTLKLA